MLLTAPPLAIFLLIPFVIALPLTLIRRRLGGWLFAACVTLTLSFFICLGLTILLAGYRATGTSIGAALILLQYFPLALISVAFWMVVEKAIRRRTKR